MSSLAKSNIVRAPRRSFSSKPRSSAPRGSKGGCDIEVVITPEDFDHRIDRRNNPYAWVRGVLSYRNRKVFRTVMVQGEAYHLISHLLTVGTSLKIVGYRSNVIDRQTGKVGGEVFRAKEVLKVYDAEGREIDGSTGRILTGHERTGHYRRQHYGPNNSLVKIVWIDKVKVNGGSQPLRKAA